MALFYDTAGIPIQIATPNINYGALASVRPLSFGQDPIQIAPLAPWSMPEAKPYIAQGITQAGAGIGQGLAAAGRAKTELERQKAIDARELAKETARNAREDAIESARAKLEQKKLTSAETIARLKAVGTKSNSDINQLSNMVSGALQNTPTATLDQQPAVSNEAETPGLRSARKMAQERVEKSATLATLPQYGEPNLKLPIEPTSGESENDGALIKPPKVEQIKPSQMDRVFSVEKSGQGGLYDSNVIEEFIKKFNQNNSEWRAVGAEPTKEGYNIKYVNIKDEADKAAQKERTLSDNEKKAIQRSTYQEGQGIVTHPAFKNYEGINGMKSMMRSFMSAYDNVKEDPKAAGTADVDLINTYARATSGGKVTEGEVKLMINAKNFADKLNLIKDKPLSGAILSDRQRDQMMRTMAEMHNAQAAGANSVLLQGRDKLIASGQTNDVHLPHLYVDNIMLKSDAARAIAKNDLVTAQLLESAKKAAAQNDSSALTSIKEELSRVSSESEELASRLKKERYTNSLLLGKKDFETKRQGFVGGGIGIGFGGQEPTTESAQ